MKLERCVAETPLTREPDMILPRTNNAFRLYRAGCSLNGWYLRFCKAKGLICFFFL